MRKIIKFVHLICMTFLFALEANALDSITSPEKFVSTVENGIEVCSLVFELNQYSAEADQYLAKAGIPISKQNEPSYQGCIVEWKNRLKASYPTVLKPIKSASARDAFKAYYIKALSSLDAIDATPGELKIQYKARERANKDKLNELWIAFQVENE